MSYLVKIPEVEELGKGIKGYESQIDSASESLKEAIYAFLVSDSFEGHTGDSMRAYMEEVHIPLIDNVGCLVEQLTSDYACYYMSEYESGTTAGDTYGEYSESAFSGAKGKLENLEETYVPSINSYLSHAMECIGGICAVSRPSTSKLETSIGDEIQKVWDLKGRVSDIEGQGKDAFSSMDSEFGNLAQSIIAAIERCNNGQCSVANYTPGSFSQVATETGLRDNYLAAMKNQSENAQLVHDAYDQAYSNIQLRIDDAEKEAAEKKKKWAFLGTVAQATSVLVGAFAIVAMFPVSTIWGAAAVVAGGLGVIDGFSKLGSRGDQLGKMLSGDYGADLTTLSIDGASDAKKLSKDLDKASKGYASGNTSDLIISGVDAGTFFLKKALSSWFWDPAKELFDNEKSDMEFDLAEKASDEVIDGYVDYALTGKSLLTRLPRRAS